MPPLPSLPKALLVTAFAAVALCAPDASAQQVVGGTQVSVAPQPAPPMSPAARARHMRRLAAALMAAPGTMQPLQAQNPGTYTLAQVQTGQNVNAWLMAMAVDPAGTAPIGLVPGFGGQSLLIRIHVPSTGADEIFSLFVPDSPPSDPRPLLVGFHGFAVSHLDLTFSTTFAQECRNRDWFMVAPFQLSTVGIQDVSYGSPQSQEHVEAVIRWVRQRYNVDGERIYGVGFSMGGGAALSYAARHRDAREGAFAAVVNHTGTVSTRNTYWNVPPLVQDQMELLFGGDPNANRYEYQRSSVVEIDGAGNLDPVGRHMAVNLEQVAVRTVYGTADPVTYAVNQCVILGDFLDALPFADAETLPVPVPAPCFQPGRSPHCWDTLVEAEACDWLETKTLRVATRGSLLVDEGGRWEQFDLTQQSARQFSSLDFLFEQAANRAILFGQENLAEIAFDPADGGLDPGLPLDVALRTADGTASRTVIHGVAAPPSDVLRGGVSAVQSCLPPGLFPTWCYNPAAGTVTINEPSPDLSVWTIVP